MKITIVGPDFFSYTDAIVTELNGMGVQARWFDERGSTTFFNKAIFRSRVLKVLCSFLIKRRHSQIMDQVVSYDSTHVLFISPDTLNIDLISRLRNEGIVVALYMWDSFENKPTVKKCLKSIQKKASFDPQDVESYGLEYIGLFAETDYFSDPIAATERSYDVTFIGTAHSDRPEALKRLSRNGFFKHLNAKVHLYGGNAYYHSVAALKLFNSEFPSVTSKKLSKFECSEIFKSSKYVLDITHKHQRGLTSRTFEALAAGCHLITNNVWAPRLLPEFKDRILVVTDSNVPQISQLSWEPANYSGTQRTQLSLRRFCLNLLELLA